eukprot:284815285_5
MCVTSASPGARYTVTPGVIRGRGNVEGVVCDVAALTSRRGTTVFSLTPKPNWCHTISEDLLQKHTLVLSSYGTSHIELFEPCANLGNSAEPRRRSAWRHGRFFDRPFHSRRSSPEASRCGTGQIQELVKSGKSPHEKQEALEFDMQFDVEAKGPGGARPIQHLGPPRGGDQHCRSGLGDRCPTARPWYPQRAATLDTLRQMRIGLKTSSEELAEDQKPVRIWAREAGRENVLQTWKGCRCVRPYNMKKRPTRLRSSAESGWHALIVSNTRPHKDSIR